MWRRDRGRCQRCGRRLEIRDANVHHRVYRARARSSPFRHHPVNLVLLGQWTACGCHEHVHAHAEWPYVVSGALTRTGYDGPDEEFAALLAEDAIDWSRQWRRPGR